MSYIEADFNTNGRVIRDFTVTNGRGLQSKALAL